MLLVQCSNQKDSAKLEQSFTREGNYFSVPFKKTGIVMDLIGTLRYQYFAEEIENQRKFEGRNENEEQIKNESKLLENIVKMADNSLKFKLSISELRQIFQQVKELEDKLKSYQSHILKLDQIFMMDQENQDEEQDLLGNSSKSINYVFQNILQKEKTSKKVKSQEQQHKTQQQHLLENIKNLEVDKNLKLIKSLSSFSSSDSENSFKDVNQLTHENLRILIPSTPKGYETAYKKIEQEVLSEKCEQMEVTRVSDEAAYDGQTNTTFYCPWKKTEKEKRKMMSSFFASFSADRQENSSYRSTESEFVEDLSGDIRPLPSVLINESINELVACDQKQDIRKSHILKESIMGIAKNSFKLKDKVYEQNLKELKLNQKLNKQAFNRERKRNELIKTAPTSMQKKKPQSKKKSFIETSKEEKERIFNKQKQSNSGLFFKFKQACFGK